MNELLSIIVPVYNEQEVLDAFHERLCNTLKNLPFRSEIIYINDGSADASVRLLYSIRETDPRVGIIDLSRNFGKETAMAAGIDHAKGDAVIIIDADLQDPPELISELVKEWKNGYDMVYAKRTSRAGETWFKKMTARYFYRIIRKMSRIPIPEDTGDFRLLSRRAVESFKKMRECHRFSKGLFSWIGYPQKAVTYNRDPRFGGSTKWNYPKLLNLAIEGITSFSAAPLKFATVLGVLTSVFSFVYAAVIVLKTLAFGEVVKGYPSLIVVVLFLGGVQLISIGIIGEYVGRIFNETKRRPLYFLNGIVPPDTQIQRRYQKLPQVPVPPEPFPVAVNSSDKYVFHLNNFS